ncbi:DUF6653 family protein [Pantanalinema rosaneae CENA516]|uniref:DUF6653 family protein n=1 Tax=Pantanalinema rosaneae TaxID=1620701 RepID=UPI003D6E7271
MTVERKIAAAFQMSEDTWARHANPWSVWTRFTVLPLLILAIWSRVWWGWWALVPVTIALLWMWLNPRLFAKPQSTNHWASKAVFGERVWLNRDVIPVPRHHRHVPNLLSLVATIGMGFVIWGLVVLHLWAIAFGCALVYLGKLWFIDRMVWLYEDMKDADPAYKQWVYEP